MSSAKEAEAYGEGNCIDMGHILGNVDEGGMNTQHPNLMNGYLAGKAKEVLRP